MSEAIMHPFPPLFSQDSKVLILGSFPSLKSRESMFYYGHPQNRFWKVISAVTNESVPQSVDEKQTLLLRHAIALWDSIKSCEITGSSDSSIRNVVANDLTTILSTAEIQLICCNGKKSHELYNKYIRPNTNREAICLPSTSPANASWSMEMLINEYRSALGQYIL